MELPGYSWPELLGYSCPEFGTKPQREVPLTSGDIQISLQHSVGYVEASLPVKNQLDSSSSFDRIPACDGQMDRQDTGRQQMPR